jgi:TRAP-type uncharacterized transport system fused permease subunit
MGMPTAAVYVLLATLVAPSIVEGLTKYFGSEVTDPEAVKMAAHMFILYGGMLSMITPPVALAAYAAANISGAGPMETGWWSMRIGWAKFVLPFLFVLSPTLLLFGHPGWIVFDTLTAAFGIYLVTAGMVGWFERTLGTVERIMIVAAGVIALMPATVLSVYFKGDSAAIASLLGAGLLKLFARSAVGRRHAEATTR